MNSFTHARSVPSGRGSPRSGVSMSELTMSSLVADTRTEFTSANPYFRQTPRFAWVVQQSSALDVITAHTIGTVALGFSAVLSA